MKTKTIKTRLAAGLLSLVMIFSLFASSAGAVAAQTTQKADTVTEQPGEAVQNNAAIPETTESQDEAALPETLSAQPASASVQVASNNGASELQENQIQYNFRWVIGDYVHENLGSMVVNFVDENGKAINLKELLGADYSSQKNIDINMDLPEKRIVSIESMISDISSLLAQQENGAYTFCGANYRMSANLEVKNTFDSIEYKHINARPATYRNGGKSSFDEVTVENVNTVIFGKAIESYNGVDSASQGVEIQMFDYKKSTPNFEGVTPWGVGQNGKLAQGLVKRNLQENANGEKIPVSIKPNSTNVSGEMTLDQNFSTINNSNYKGFANGLFNPNVYKSGSGDMPVGTFYYSSFENYAYWNQPETSAEIGWFNLYDQIGTPEMGPSGVDQFFYKRGNFMPYNPIVGGKLSENKNLYDENGRALQEGIDPRWNEALYKTQKPDTSKVPAEDIDANGNDFYFGMVVSANFSQLENGQLNGSDMVYKFNGDDDMWVFIDGVLVLDLGGVRDAQSGEINFATGDITWTDFGRNEVQKYGKATIKEQFEEAKKEDSSLLMPDFNGNTFSSNSSHEIKIFYMERGAGASNCKIQFNLPIVPKDSITVAKEVSNINEGSYNDVDFRFKLYVEAEQDQDLSGETVIQKDGISYILQKDRPYHLKQGSEMKDENAKTSAEGVFTLKHGQQAYFEKIIEKGQKYIVEETDLTQNSYDEFSANGTVIDGSAVGDIITDPEAGTSIVRTQPIIAGVGKGNYVTFKNSCSGQNLHSLNITKKMNDGQKNDEDFTAQVTIGGRLFAGTYTILDKEGKPVGAAQKAKDGVIQLKADQTININDIAGGTSFEVKEINLNDQYKTPNYALANASNPIIGDGVSGRMNKNLSAEDKTAKVTITNTKKISGLTIKKTINEVNYIDGDPIFTFKITEVDQNGNPIYAADQQQYKTVLYRTLRFKEGKGNNAEITIANLPVGFYKVEELSTMRYTCTSENPQIIEVKGEEQQEETKAAEFANNLTAKGKYSHTDMVENSFKINKETGEVTCEQNKVPSGQTPNDQQGTQQVQ